MAETLPEAAAPGTGQQFKLVDVSTTPSEGGCGCGCGGHGKKEQAAPAAPETESHGGCGCGGHGHKAEAAPAPQSHGGCGCGGHGAQEAPKAEASAHGGCGCGDHGQGTAHVVSQDPAVREDELVIHSLPKVVRHALLFAAMDNLPLGASLIVVAPHQPVPLFNYLQESESHYRVETIETGPVDWRYRVTRLS